MLLPILPMLAGLSCWIYILAAICPNDPRMRSLSKIRQYCVRAHSYLLKVPSEINVARARTMVFEEESDFGSKRRTPRGPPPHARWRAISVGDSTCYASIAWKTGSEGGPTSWRNQLICVVARINGVTSGDVQIYANRFGSSYWSIITCRCMYSRVSNAHFRSIFGGGEHHGWSQRVSCHLIP